MHHITSPNNLTALRALSEHQVMMASGLLGLLRSIAGTLGPALSVVFWDQRHGRSMQLYAENTPVDALGLSAAMRRLRLMLAWTGEIAVQIPTKTTALLHQRLLAEASTAAWQDYLLLNAVLALLSILPAVLVSNRLWRHFRPAETVSTVAKRHLAKRYQSS